MRNQDEAAETSRTEVDVMCKTRAYVFGVEVWRSGVELFATSPGPVPRMFAWVGAADGDHDIISRTLSEVRAAQVEQGSLNVRVSTKDLRLVEHNLRR